MNIFICKNCNKNFCSISKKRKFCCLDCAHTYNKKHKKVGGNKVSLEKFKERFGEEIGIIKYENWKDKISKSNKGRGCFWKGKNLSKNHKEAISKGLKGTDKQGVKGKNFEEIHGKGSLKKHKEKMKGTFSLEWFVKKHGKINGIKKYNERCENIKKTTFFNKYNKENKNNYSKLSQELFWLLYNSGCSSRNVYFAELNHEYGCGTNKNFDFVDIDRRKIIEFNGDKFHGNPKIYKKSDYPNPYMKDLTAEKIWDLDYTKNKKAIENGFDILIVWESEWIESKEKQIEKCKEFLNGKI